MSIDAMCPLYADYYTFTGNPQRRHNVDEHGRTFPRDRRTYEKMVEEVENLRHENEALRRSNTGLQDEAGPSRNE